jgi:ssDNA-binding Zn-finger/Zn-ribbon topoisomerase 1
MTYERKREGSIYTAVECPNCKKVSSFYVLREQNALAYCCPKCNASLRIASRLKQVISVHVYNRVNKNVDNKPNVSSAETES